MNDIPLRAPAHPRRAFRKAVRWIIRIAVILAVLAFAVLFIGPSSPAEEVAWGVNFSAKHASLLDTDWHASYEALLKDLEVRRVKVLTAWDEVEPEPGAYSFSVSDFLLNQAAVYGADVTLVIGMKTGRWPECHLPAWAKSLSKEEQENRVLGLLGAYVDRYRHHPALVAWQVENEAMFPFGDCPWYDTSFLKREVALVKAMDPTRPVVVTDSGELSLWWKAASIGDVVGTTLYRDAWFSEFDRTLTYPLPAAYYGRKAWLVKTLFGKPVWNVELQAEPWGRSLLYDLPLEEQRTLMTPEKFRGIIAYAKRTGLDTFYLWGAEWWYAMKEKHHDPVLWEAAREVLRAR